MICLLKAGIAEPEKPSIPRLQQSKQPAIAKQLLCKHVNVEAEADETPELFLEKQHATIEDLLEAVFSMLSKPTLYSDGPTCKLTHPCGGGVKYLHRDPASRRRRRKGKSEI
jgi:hypothetical protein